MELKDLLTFAKAGYTPAQVKELLAIQTVPQPAEPQPAEPQPAEPQPAEPQPVEPQPAEPQPVDYKSLYEESQKKLKEAQSINVHTNIEPLKENDDEIVIRMISNFL